MSAANDEIAQRISSSISDRRHRMSAVGQKLTSREAWDLSAGGSTGQLTSQSGLNSFPTAPMTICSTRARGRRHKRLLIRWSAPDKKVTDGPRTLL